MYTSITDIHVDVIYVKSLKYNCMTVSKLDDKSEKLEYKQNPHRAGWMVCVWVCVCVFLCATFTCKVCSYNWWEI